MSRIGKRPVAGPGGRHGDRRRAATVTVKGPKGELTRTLHPEMAVALEDGAGAR